MRTLLNALLALLFALAFAPGAQAQDLDQLVNGFDQRREQADQARDEQLKKLNDSYTVALKRLLDRTKSGGSLDAVRPVNDEITAIEDNSTTLPPLPDTAPAELKKLRATYDDSRHKILRTHATNLTDLATKLDTALKRLEADLTKTGKIAAAVAAREAREELAKDHALNDARDLLKLGGANAKGKPALQLRRYGDNLEVLVYYDRAGKISMDSPVENTRERTGEGKELGDTKAKVLGEFVGAKGYRVDPYVAFDHKFDGKDTGGMVFGGIDHTEAVEMEKEKGMRIGFGRQKVETYFTAIGNVLPPKSVGGTVRIGVRYYVPKPNRAVNGIRLETSSGARIGNPLVSSGKWVSTTLEGECDQESASLIVKLSLREKMGQQEAGDDFVVLGAIKVEHVALSAFVQKRISDEGTPIEENNEASRQPLLIRGGEIQKM